MRSGTASAALGGTLAAVAMNGPGFVLLAGPNTYGGGTTVSAGTLQLGNASALGTPSGTLPLQVNGGLLDLNGQTITAGGLSGSGGTVASSSGGGVLVLTPASPANFSGTIAGATAVTLNAPGAVQTLSAANSYTGATTVTAGTLALGAAGTLGSGNTTITPGATLDVSAYGSGYSFSGGTLTAGPTPPGGTDVNGSLNVTGALLSVAGGSPSGAMTINGNLALSGGTVSLGQGGTIALTGGGALSLAGTDVIAPLAQLNTGTYTLFSYGSLAAGGTADLVMGGPFGSSPRQTYAFDASSGTAVTLTVAGFIGNLQWTGGSNSTWDTGTSQSWYNLSTSAADYFYGGDTVTFNDTPGTATTVNISGNVAPGTLTVSNTNVSYTFSGTGSIGGSTSLLMNGPGALTINNSNVYTGGTSLGGGLLNLGNAAALGSGTLTISGGSLDNSSGTAMTLAGNIAQNWNGSFAFLGSSPLNMGTGPVTLGTSATVTLCGTGALTVAGAIGDGGNNYSLTVIGPGPLVLAGSNTYGGGTKLISGVLVINNNGALGSGSLTINGGSLDSTVAGVTLANNPQNWNADFTFLGSQNLNLGAGAVTLCSSRTVTVNAGILTVAGAISDSGSGYSLTKAGTGTLNLSGSNTYTGDTMIALGTLQVGGSAAIPTGAGAGNVDFTTAASAAVLDINGIDTTINGLSQPNPSTTNLVVNNLSGTHTLTVGNNNATSTFAGILANNTGSGGVLALAKIGSGILTLAGTNTYTGNTSIGGGTLALVTGTTLPSVTTLNFSGTSTLNLNGNSQTVANMSSFADNSVATIAGTTGSSLTVSPATLNVEPTTTAATSLALNMASVGSFTYNNPAGTVSFGQVAGGGVATRVVATLSAGTNAITANVLDVGNNESSSTVPSTTLYLGASNSLAVNTINVGFSGDRPEGTVSFAAGLVNPVLTITGTAGGASTANLNIGSHDSNATAGNGHYTATDLFDTSAGTLNAQLGTVIIGQEHVQTSGIVRWIAYSSTLNMGAGLLTSNSMSVGLIQSGGTGTAYEFSASGAFNLTGGTAKITSLTVATNNFVYALSPSNNNTLSGEVTLNNGNLYATTIQEGPMAVAPSGTLNVTAQINWNGGTIGNLAGSNLNVSGVSLVTSAAGTANAFNISAAQTGTVNSVISGTGAIASVGPGTLVLNGSNTYSGGTFVEGSGTLQVGSNAAFGLGGLAANSGMVDLAGFTPAVATLNGLAGTITSSVSGASLTVSGSGSGVFSGTIEDDPNLSPGSAPVSLILAQGELTLNGENTYSGGTTVSGGTLILGNSEAIAAGSSLTVGNASAFEAVAQPMVAVVPEPGTLLLLAAGMMGAAVTCRFRRRYSSRSA